MSEANNQNNMNGKDFLLGAVVGGIIGAAAALLLAPKTGKELRGDIAGQYQNVTEKTKEIYGTVSTRGKEVFDTVSTKGREMTGKAKEAAAHIATDIRNWKESKEQSAPAAETGTDQADNAALDNDSVNTDK
ncbi:YtxH domain-containing protein [Marinicrinis lubricantis]|uniref:YtxH domain-containing protein n=1 Tax=Marinicrinis lubricantis TaxID=2086470 RepID=A0ABW1ITV9_9BACL